MKPTKYANKSASATIKTGAGVLLGMYVNSTSSGTIKFNDGLTGTAAGDKATGTITVTDVFSDGETITIGNKTYTMKTNLTGAANEVLIGASAAASLDNLKSAVNGSAGAGTTYGTGTVAHTQVTAETNTDTTQLIQAASVGTAGNLIATTTDGANASFGAVTLTGGAEAAPLINNTITPAIGYHNLGGAAFTNGLRATIANTLDVTIYYQ